MFALAKRCRRLRWGRLTGGLLPDFVVALIPKDGLCVFAVDAKRADAAIVPGRRLIKLVAVANFQIGWIVKKVVRVVEST